MPAKTSVRKASARGGCRPCQAAIQAAFDEYGVLALPDQDIDDDQQIAYSRGFGDLETSVRYNQPGGSTRPELSYIGNVDPEGKLYPVGDKRSLPGTQRWHSDSSFRATPAKYSLLSARQIPVKGADTQFADMRAAYDALDDETKAEVADLICEHSQVFSRQQLGDGAAEGFIDITDNNPSAVAHIPARGLRPDSARAACDDADPVFETCHLRPLIFSSVRV